MEMSSIEARRCAMAVISVALAMLGEDLHRNGKAKSRSVAYRRGVAMLLQSEQQYCRGRQVLGVD